MAGGTRRIDPTASTADLAPPGDETLGAAGEERPLWERILIWLAPNMTAFMASFCIMVLELVAGRVVARHLGQSLYTWTSVIGVVLAGITLGNLVGGRLADWFRPAAVLAVLFLLASGVCLSIPVVNQVVGDWSAWGAKLGDATWQKSPWFERAVLRTLHWFSGSGAPEKLDWSAHIFGQVFLVFLLPSTILGTIGPVVAKMALDQGRRIGRTVGNVYAWGALGSIAGTFTTGFYLISKLGTSAVILSVGLVLGAMGTIYSLTRFWRAAGPAAAIASFLAVSWAFSAPAAGLMVLLVDVNLDRTDPGQQLFTVKPWPFEWVKRGSRTVLREKATKEVVHYLDESDYSFIKIDKSDEEDGCRDLVLDNLIHAHYSVTKPTKLYYEYEDIYKAITHRAAPPGAEKDGVVRTLFIGGGGYVFPRYLQAIWPGCKVEIAEIDPAVTAADLAAFGLEERQIQLVSSLDEPERPGNPFRVYHLDARNHVEDLVRAKDAGQPVGDFDFIYGDAFNDYAVPFHLTTREFNEKVKLLLKPASGVYLINIIDIFDRRRAEQGKRKSRSGLFLGAIYNTFRETFGENVYVFCTSKDEPSNIRDTYIVIGSMRPLDLTDLPGSEEPYVFNGSLLREEHLRALTDDEHAGAMVLTDDYAPVENLLKDVVNRRKE